MADNQVLKECQKRLSEVEKYDIRRMKMQGRIEKAELELNLMRKQKETISEILTAKTMRLNQTLKLLSKDEYEAFTIANGYLIKEWVEDKKVE